MKAVDEVGTILNYLEIDLLKINMGLGTAYSTFCSSEFLLWSHLAMKHVCLLLTAILSKYGTPRSSLLSLPGETYCQPKASCSLNSQVLLPWEQHTLDKAKLIANIY